MDGEVETKERRMDCVKEDMRVERVNYTLTAYRNEWKKVCCADSTIHIMRGKDGEEEDSALY